MKRYRDMLVAKGTLMYELMESKDPKDRERLKKEYEKSNEEFHKTFPLELWGRLNAKRHHPS